MKYIFSRKGFDSTAGGYPSLIFPDGSLFSIPIPSSKEKYGYNDLPFRYKDDSIQEILNDLTSKNIHSEKWQECDYEDNKQSCHYDPMPIKVDEFQGIALGQANQAEGHLRNQEIGEGDVFLFYGWFKKVKKQDVVWIYENNAPDIHLIWSYMEIGACLCIDTDELQDQALDKYPFLEKHPHIGDQDGSKNRIYLSVQHKHFSFKPERCLTDVKNFKGRATWRLPAYFHQPGAFSYLNDFILDEDHTVVSFRGYGQEFVLDLDKVKPDSDKKFIKRYISDLIGHRKWPC